MLKIGFSDVATKQVDDIISNQGIYDQFGHFTQQYVN